MKTCPLASICPFRNIFPPLLPFSWMGRPRTFLSHLMAFSGLFFFFPPFKGVFFPYFPFGRPARLYALFGFSRSFPFPPRWLKPRRFLWSCFLAAFFWTRYYLLAPTILNWCPFFVEGCSVRAFGFLGFFFFFFFLRNPRCPSSGVRILPLVLAPPPFKPSLFLDHPKCACLFLPFFWHPISIVIWFTGFRKYQIFFFFLRT